VAFLLPRCRFSSRCASLRPFMPTMLSESEGDRARVTFTAPAGIMSMRVCGCPLAGVNTWAVTQLCAGCGPAQTPFTVGAVSG
jgi:hypothetical protein